MVAAEAVAQNLRQLSPQNWDAACNHLAEELDLLPAVAVAVAVGLLLAAVVDYSRQSFLVVVDLAPVFLPLRTSMTTNVVGTAPGPPSMAGAACQILAFQAASQLEGPRLRTRSAAETCSARRQPVEAVEAPVP